MRFPISVKLFLMTFFILLLALLPTAYRNYNQVKKEAVDREWQFISSQSESKSQEIELILQGIVEDSLLSATYLLEKTYGKNQINIVLNPFSKNAFMLNIDIFEMQFKSPKLVYRESKEALFKNSTFKEQGIEKIRQSQAIYFAQALKGVFIIKRLADYSAENEVNIFTLFFPVSKDAKGEINRIAAVDVSTRIFSKAFQNSSSSVSYVTDSQGHILAGSLPQFYHNLEFTNSSLLNTALQDKSKNQLQQKFIDPNFKKEYIGSFIRTSLGPILVFQSPLKEVLAPAEQVKAEFIKNLIYAISISFLLISLFSLTLTRPLERLVSLIPLVSKGEFNLNATSKIKTNDEVGDLATAFDQMTQGLQERDKVKTLFQKFHGTHVANDILNSKIALGGQNKNVIVFFSDIRGFTAFSESKAPEEVVSMLNEYFAIMVEIINRNGGVVDKFIGDAIMAVWGAPNSHERDAQNAVSACLQMRLALNELNESRLERNLPTIQIGMGLHAGQAISGTIGSQERMEYTVIGNTVNTASRVEASTKAFGTDLLITAEVANAVAEEFLLEEAGHAEVKGRSQALQFFKVRGYFSEEKNEWVEITTPYSDFEKEDAEKVKIA